MKINSVIVEVHRPNEETGYPGQVEEGQYIVKGGSVTLVDVAGSPLIDRYGNAYSQKLQKEDNPRVIARRLLKQRWRDRNGDKSNFNRPIHYPKVSF